MDKPKPKTATEIQMEKDAVKRKTLLDLYEYMDKNGMLSAVAPKYFYDMIPPEYFEPPKPTKVKCKECKKVIGIEPAWYTDSTALSKHNGLYCPTCWKIKKLTE